MLTVRETREVTNISFRNIYDISFTPDEKIPLKNIERTFGFGGSLLFYYDSDDFVGFTYSFCHENLVFLVYFATLPEKRNMGYGTRILTYLKERFSGYKMFLVVETPIEGNPDYVICTRRKEFYSRNGWKDTGIRLLSDGCYFDSMYLGAPIERSEMVRVVEYYEQVHNGGF